MLLKLPLKPNLQTSNDKNSTAQVYTDNSLLYIA